jgi:hypothetical protein
MYLRFLLTYFYITHICKDIYKKLDISVELTVPDKIVVFDRWIYSVEEKLENTSLINCVLADFYR